MSFLVTAYFKNFGWSTCRVEASNHEEAKSKFLESHKFQPRNISVYSESEWSSYRSTLPTQRDVEESYNQ